MLPPETILSILLATYAGGSVFRIIAGAARVPRNQESKPRYDLVDVVFGLLGLGAVVIVVML